MHMLRLVLVSLVCGGLILLLGWMVLRGLRSGRIAHSDSTSWVARRDNPLRFWVLVILFSALMLVSAGVWVRILWGARY